MSSNPNLTAGSFSLRRAFSTSQTTMDFYPRGSSYAHGLQPFVAKIADLRQSTATDGWDDGRGKATSEADWKMLERIAFSVAANNRSGPGPVASAEPDGSVCVRWTREGADVFVELKGSKVWFTYVDAKGEGESRDLSAEVDQISEAVAQKLS